MASFPQTPITSGNPVKAVSLLLSLLEAGSRAETKKATNTSSIWPPVFVVLASKHSCDQQEASGDSGAYRAIVCQEGRRKPWVLDGSSKAAAQARNMFRSPLQEASVEPDQGSSVERSEMAARWYHFPLEPECCYPKTVPRNQCCPPTRSSKPNQTEQRQAPGNMVLHPRSTQWVKATSVFRQLKKRAALHGEAGTKEELEDLKGPPGKEHSKATEEDAGLQAALSSFQPRQLKE